MTRSKLLNRLAVTRPSFSGSQLNRYRKEVGVVLHERCAALVSEVAWAGKA
jgi:hypothetical protein